jgi:hypothetical protein
VVCAQPFIEAISQHVFSMANFSFSVVSRMSRGDQKLSSRNKTIFCLDGTLETLKINSARTECIPFAMQFFHAVDIKWPFSCFSIYSALEEDDSPTTAAVSLKNVKHQQQATPLVQKYVYKVYQKINIKHD